MTLLDTLPAEATLRDAVVAAVSRAAAHNPNDAVAPAVILWTDKERQWEGLLPELRQHLPLLTLGPYLPEERSGPAFWLRCAIADVLDPAPVPARVTPVIYLPGVSRSDLRAVESCPKELQPLAELQYRGVFWSHRNGRDWTIAGFLQSPDGLNTMVQGDTGTAQMLQAGLPRLAQEPLAVLTAAAPLTAEKLRSIIDPDAGRRLLRWLNDPQTERSRVSEEEWQIFLASCQDRFRFHPDNEGPITGIARLADRKGEWKKLWAILAGDLPSYPGIIAHLEKGAPAQLSLFEAPAAWEGADDPRTSWLPHNRAAEEQLRHALRALEQRTAPEARAAVRQLEVAHAVRRGWIWAALGHAPLALALEHLADLATRAEHPVAGLHTADIIDRYVASGWRTDLALLHALAATANLAPDDEAALRTAATALYRDWLEQTAVTFQQAVAGGDTLDYPADPMPEAEDGACLLFVDGLRFDLGMALAEALQARGLEPSVTPRLAALPPVTATAKPAVAPVAGRLTGNGGLETLVAPAGPKVTAPVLHKQLTAAGFQILRGDEAGDPTGRAWTEQGEIDKYGHNHGLRVARHGLQEVEGLASRIRYLLEAGWREVIVVTDHGWLLLPGGLPVATLPEHLTEVRKGRCARLQEGATTDAQTVPWHWNPAVRIAVAPGIRCYEAGKVYEHGGLSPQECVTPVITVRAAARPAHVAIDRLRWQRLKCLVTLSGFGAAMTIDLRTHAADPASSIAHARKSPELDGAAAIFVAPEYDDREGDVAFIVVTDEGGAILAQQQTVIGG